MSRIFADSGLATSQRAEAQRGDDSFASPVERLFIAVNGPPEPVCDYPRLRDRPARRWVRLVGLHRQWPERDRYFVLADFEAYAGCQQAVARAFRDRDGWTRSSILNVARTGWFSSDRAIREYCDQVWDAVPVRIGG